MGEKCDLEACSLKSDIDEIKRNQQAMTKANHENALAQTAFVQKMGDFLETYKDDKKENKEQHDILFNRTRGGMTWTHFGMALGGVATILTIFATVLKIAGVY